MMRSTMAHLPLTIPMMLSHGARMHAGSTVRGPDGGGIASASFAEMAGLAGRLASALDRLGIGVGDCVGTLCWNHVPHMAAYLAVPSMGAVLHTLNCRLSADQLAFIIEDAGDRVIIADASVAPLLADALSLTSGVAAVILVGAPDAPFDARPVFDFDRLVAEEAPGFEWVEPDETAAAVACYTSGTTGNPKGVVYSHRSIFLHSMGSLGADTFGISQADRILLLPPMFHANAWGLPYSAWLSGADLIMPGRNLHSSALRRLIEEERPTFTAAVPTLINDLLVEHRANPIDMSCFRVIVGGGSALPPSLIRAVRLAWNVPVLQGWGMTETGPLCALAVPPRDMVDPELQDAVRAKSGRPVPGMEVRLVDEEGHPLPNDGGTVGELQIRGLWATGAYHGNRSPDSFTDDGWIRTGDMGTIDAAGYAQITDRTKDVIKSGGEWISSVALEALLLEHPNVAEAAVVAVADERWGERPLAVVVTAGGDLGPTELRAHIEPAVARFWVPERWAFTSQLPKTSVGKIDKKALREQVEAGRLDIVRADG